jgi:hypothetical protein
VNRTQGGLEDAILKAIADHPQVDDPRLVKGHGRGHNFDEDAVCTDCGFDGAEWSHLRRHAHPDDRDLNAKPPLCTHVGRAVDEWPPLQHD